MATTVTITGTGSPIPSPTRAGPGVLVEAGGLRLQFDAGRSTLERITAAGVNIAELDALFVTHHHSDHLVGLPDIVMTRWVTSGGRPTEPLPVVVPHGPTVEFLDRMLDPWEADLEVRAAHTGSETRPEFDVIAFDSTDAGGVVWESGGVTVRAREVRHEPVCPAVGYRIETDDGAVVISGDTLVCDEVAELAQGARVLVYEAMLFEFIQAQPEPAHFIMDYHADTRLLGAQAAELGVEMLVLTHLIPEPTTPELATQYVDTIRAGGFAGELVIANDLDTITLDPV
ncbi:MAG: MBL fold metallo-hydrolase [Ilumatobacter sp.]